jgi:hypothetical protein
MTDPRRLIEGNPDSLERRVLRSAAGDRPSPRSEAAAVAGFSATLSLAAHGSAALGVTGVTVKSAWSLYLVKGVVGGLLGAATCVGTYAAIEASMHPRRDSHAPASITGGPREHAKAQAAASSFGTDAVSAPAPTRPATEEAPPSAVGSASRTYAPRPSRSGQVRQADPDTLAREVALLREARLALARGDARAALGAIDRRDREFPRGALGPEATLLRVESLVRAGDRAGAEAVASSFLRYQPRGPHADRMRALLGENKP